MAADRALQIAFNTAAHASVILSDADIDVTGPLNFQWPSFGFHQDPDLNRKFAGEMLAPFVRDNRQAPPEALYIHGRGIVHDNRKPWAVLPLPDAFAYALFVLVLNQTDAEIARIAAAKAEAERRATPHPPRRPKRDDHVMEEHDGLLDRETLSDPRLSRRRQIKKKRPKFSLPVKRGV